ncbi:AAA family ATPase [Cupriavidus sp. IK-TO18]|uniref:AAA family ATPase n=1 Tax=Cupriavidus sp. IK-TO18 TaxID=2782182 RepID=UPI00189BC0AF|nr:AAA family ATPase [Cupriavidus sp. IK-TO18]MBF6986501.1 AAA family ATPase [Cupriavidus sp. IK-TO18]
MRIITKEEAIFGSGELKCEYMRQHRLNHRTNSEVKKRVMRFLTPGTGISITIVVGPTGAGKTTLGWGILDEVYRKYSTEITADPNIIPGAYVEVPAAMHGHVDWSEFHRRAGTAVKAPLMDYRIAEFDPESTDGADVFNRSASLRHAFEQSARLRKLRHLILDECGHFLASNDEPKEYGDFLKSMASCGGMNILMLGAYGAEKIIEASSQLARRVNLVHFPRYKRSQAKLYGQFLESYSRILPLAAYLDLVPYQEILFQGCCGLVGLTCDTLMASVLEASEMGGEWKENYLWNAMPSEAKRRTILEDIWRGEEVIERYISSENRPNYRAEEDDYADFIKRKN